MNNEKLDALNTLLLVFFEEINELNDEESKVTNDMFAISDEIDNLKYKGYIEHPVLKALQKEEKYLDDKQQEIEQKIYNLIDFGDIKSLIEDINDLMKHW